MEFVELMLNIPVGFVAFDVDGAERAGRAEVFAGAAADALFFVYDRDQRRILVGRILSDHYYCPGRAMTGAVPAGYTVRIHDTILIYHDCVACLDRGFFLDGHGRYGIRRADIGTFRAFRPAPASFERHFRLHKGHQRAGRPQDLIRADGYTELTGGTVLAEMFEAQ